MPWIAAAAGLAGSYLMGQQQKKSNQASIDAMSQIANRPQQTALGSYFNPGGMSGLAPSIQGGRSDIFAGFPGYKSVLQDSTNQFLNNTGDIRQYLVGGSGYNPVYQPASSLFGARPMNTVGAKPTIDMFRTPEQRVFDTQNHGLMPSWRTIPGTDRTDYAGYNNAVANWNQLSEQEKAQQAAYDQQVQQYLASQQQPGQVGGPINPNSDFINAATSPVREAAAKEYAARERAMSRRDISGSSLSFNQLGNVSSQYGELEGRVKADAIQSAISQATGLDQSALQASTNFINNLGQLDQQQLSTLAQQAQEQLAMLGLGQASIGALMQPLQMQMVSNNQRYDSMGRAFGAAGWSLSQSGWNPFTPKTEEFA